MTEHNGPAHTTVYADKHQHQHQHDGNGGAHDEHENRQLGGYKATIHNPNTSTEAKEHAAEILAEHGVKTDYPTHQSKEAQQHEHHVIGGYKATLHNPNVSDEAKQHAKEVLKEHGFE
ncbi:hypothetical protein IAR55_002714 [Kwoniella newhampshirensis]|uniref:Conidiation-specific protein 6 n=1 Tax=Kwoniella newhampshirensis TaxID=1651941 RepID=A0AAW0YNH2_9TREE